MRNEEMKLSLHFTLGELCKTSTGLKNEPNEAQVENLKRLCGWLERLRQRYNLNIKEKIKNKNDEPIIINSGYRSPQVNKAVGGAPNSNHLTGCAADIRCLGIEQALRYATTLLDISDESKEDFDELLIEKSSRSIWVHFAVRPKDNRRKVKFLKK